MNVSINAISNITMVCQWDNYCCIHMQTFRTVWLYVT